MTEGKDNEETNVIDERDVLHLKCVKPQHKANKHDTCILHLKTCIEKYFVCVHIALKPFKYLNFQSNHLGTHKTPPPLFQYKKTLNKRSNSSHVKNLELTALDTQNKQI